MAGSSHSLLGLISNETWLQRPHHGVCIRTYLLSMELTGCAHSVLKACLCVLTLRICPFTNCVWLWYSCSLGGTWLSKNTLLLLLLLLLVVT